MLAAASVVLILSSGICQAESSLRHSDSGGRPRAVSSLPERSLGVTAAAVWLLNLGLRLSQNLGLFWLLLAKLAPRLASWLSPWLFNGMSVVTGRGLGDARSFTPLPSLTDLPFTLLGIDEDGCRRRFMCELAVWLTNRHPLLVYFLRHLSEKLPPLNKYAEVFARSVRDRSCKGFQGLCSYSPARKFLSIRLGKPWRSP